MYKEGGALPRWPIANGRRPAWHVCGVKCVCVGGGGVCIVFMFLLCVLLYLCAWKCVSVTAYMHTYVLMHMQMLCPYSICI